MENQRNRKGIPHIEDLDVEIFINTVKNLDQFTATEKLDGAQLIFGLDSSGNFYTSREAKNGARFYSEIDYGNDLWSTGFKSAHIALKNKEDLIRQVLSPNDSIEIEVLYGAQPNAIPYNKDINYIVFLRAISGTPNLKSLNDIFLNDTVSFIVNDIPYTNDGVSIQYSNQQQTWIFTNVPTISMNVAKLRLNKNISKHIENIKEYIRKPSKIAGLSNFELLTIKLNQKPKTIYIHNWGEFKEIAKVERRLISENIYKIKLVIKEILLDEIIRNAESAFGPAISAGGWIEGIVLRNNVSGFQTKLVDKNKFTKINEHNYRIRNKIQDGLWIPFKNKLKKELKTNTSVELLKNIILTDTRNTLDQLSIELDNYNPTLLNYNDEIHKRTLGVFYSTRARIENIQNKIKSANNLNDIQYIIFYEKSLKNGGNAFNSVSTIKKEQIDPTLKYISTHINISYNELVEGLLGSAGKVDVSNDIDTCIDINQHDPKLLIDTCTNWLGSNNVSHSVGLNIIHLNVPISGDSRNGLVQVDLMLTKNTEWTKFNFFSAGDKSNYKGIYRNLLLSSIASADNKIEYDGSELIKRIGWVWNPQKGLDYQIRERTKTKNGYTKSFKVVHSKKIISKPKQVIRILFNNDISVSEFDTFENVVNIVKTNFTKEKQELIFDIFNKTLLNRKVPIPVNFNV